MPDSKTLKGRIFLFIKSKGIPVSTFEKKSGLSNGYLKNIKGNVGTRKIEDILNSFPELNRTWLLSGEGEMLKHDDLHLESGQIQENRFTGMTEEEIDQFLEARMDVLINKKYEQGEIYPREVVMQMLKERDTRIEELLRKNALLEYELEQKNTRIH